jgi:HEAT repeat protein
MSKQTNLKVLFASICLLPMYPVAAQDFSACDPNYPCNPRQTTFAEELQEHGIDTSKASLITALSNSDPKVRSLAAYQLVTDPHLYAIPEVERALASEKDTGTALHIASALAGSGDPVGARRLEATCTNASLAPEMAAQAAEQLEIAERRHPGVASLGKCADAVISALEIASQSYQRRMLISVVAAMAAQTSKDQQDRIISIAQKLLQDDAPATRMRASDALAQMGSTSSIPAIRNAIQSEPDLNVRVSHQRNLDKLLKLSNSSIVNVTKQ